MYVILFVHLVVLIVLVVAKFHSLYLVAKEFSIQHRADKHKYTHMSLLREVHYLEDTQCVFEEGW